MGKLAEYEVISILLFVGGFLAVITAEKPSIHPLIVQYMYLQDLISDAEVYSWELVRAFHAIWLQQREQGRVTWPADEEVKLKYKQTIVWYRATGPPKAASAPTQ